MIDIIALIIALLALLLVFAALFLASAQSTRLAHIEALIANGINRDDIDKLHNRVNVLVEKVGALSSSVSSQSTQIGRIDHYLRKHQE